MPVRLVHTRIARRGNSAAITLSRGILSGSGLMLNEDVSVEALPGEVRVRRADTARNRCIASLEHTLSRYPKTLTELQ